MFQQEFEVDTYSDGIPLRVDDDDEEEDEVHVKLVPDGERHKRAIGGGATACGLVINAVFSCDPEYSGLLCPVCFTPYERSLTITERSRRPHMSGSHMRGKKNP